MANRNDFTQKVAGAAEYIGDQSIRIAKLVSEKACLAAQITKLNFEICAQKETIRKTEQQLGKKYYELCRDNPADVMAQGCAEITSARKKIAAKKKKAAELKAALLNVEAKEAQAEAAAEAKAEAAETAAEPEAAEAEAEPAEPEAEESEAE